jgi:hypothetical protein
VAAVLVEDLCMTYWAAIRESGWKATLGSVFRRTVPGRARRPRRLVRPSSRRGRRLHRPQRSRQDDDDEDPLWSPARQSGHVQVLGCSPWQRPADLLPRIAFIGGSPVGGSQELTVLDSLQYQRLLYKVPVAEHRRNLEELTDLPERTITASGECPLPAYRRRSTDQPHRQRACVMDYRPGAP